MLNLFIILLKMDRNNLFSPEQEKILAESISKTSTIDEIIEVIKSLGFAITDENGKQVFPALLNKAIEQVRHGHQPIDNPWAPYSVVITNSAGIRDKVLALLPDDHVYKKYSKGSKAGKRHKRINAGS
jgi:hypothetical protein